MTAEQIAAYVDATAAALALPLQTEHRPGVLHYMGLAAQMAALVDGRAFVLSDEPAPAFVPVSPGNGALV